ncbi:MAG TPA: hypothetical protein ENK75_00835, partial [Saprospiraceae bacterium]|nr:hypothetical protein [Saprospiraceae bacterium]
MEITSKIYKAIIPNLKDWPIYKFAINKLDYKNELVDIIFNDLVDKYGENLKNEIEKCAYSEIQRIKLNPWKVDPPDDEKFWTNIRTELLEGNAFDEIDYCRLQLKRIINRYVQEIFGDFRIPAFKFARIFLTYFFNRIFNGLFVGSIFNLTKRKSLKNKLLLSGYMDELRELFDKG